MVVLIKKESNRKRKLTGVAYHLKVLFHNAVFPFDWIYLDKYFRTKVEIWTVQLKTSLGEFEHSDKQLALDVETIFKINEDAQDKRDPGIDCIFVFLTFLILSEVKSQ